MDVYTVYRQTQSMMDAHLTSHVCPSVYTRLSGSRLSLVILI